MLIKTTKAFEKDLTRMQKRGKDLSKLEYLIKLLANNNVLQAKYREHKLSGNYQNLRECHIEPDWLLIYENQNNILYLARTGTHSDLFK
ncbi:MAG: type II toxin-antitoxin system YafQ family toxin [Pseudomonadota bacterium]